MKISLTGSFRSKGDAARDKALWEQAATAYKNHLLERPNDADIWIQAGHALKEQGKWDDAEDAYRNAVRLRPDNADSSLHLAHLLKRLGRISEASEMFAMSFKSHPSGEAYDELKSLRGAIPSDLDEDHVSPDTVFIEVDDLFRYLDAHKTVSGIQRVLVEIIQHVLACRGQDKTTIFVVNDENLDSAHTDEAGFTWHMQDEHLLELVSYVAGARVEHEHLKRIMERAKKGAKAIIPRGGHSYLVLGAFWGGVAGMTRYLAMKKNGVTLGVYIYDLIPLTHPEYCDAGLSHNFALAFADAMEIFNYVLTISEFTASEVVRYRKKFNHPQIPVIAVPLAHTQSGNPLQQRMGWSPKIEQFKHRPFVLMVSTIEARKNHIYLITAWKQFLDENLDPPDLVFVGRIGWRVSGMIEMLEQTRNLNGRVHILHDLSDVELQTLYKASLFTAFPSFVEGWGLPVGESLACGRACVASSTSSIPEVGGDLVDYLDPHNLRAGTEVLRKMAFNETYRVTREHAIAERLVLRHWRDVGADLLREIKKLRSHIKATPEWKVLVPSGSVFKVPDLVFDNILPSNYPICPVRLLLAPFCYGVEQHGCWIRGNHGIMSFRSDLPINTEIVVYISFIGAPRATKQNMITIDADPARSRHAVSPDVAKGPILANGKFLMRCFGKIGDKGDVTISFQIGGEISLQHDRNDHRHFAVGIVGFGYASRNDPVSRVEISEALMYHLS